VTGNTNDTVWVNQPGSYSVSCIITNQYGCSVNASASVSLQYKHQPVIAILSSTGVICPNDSVQLVSIDSTVTGQFQWQGPGGPIGGNTNSIWVNQAGNYSCIVTDAEGCALVSNTLLVQQYATPYLDLYPTAVLCQGDSLVLNVVAGAGSVVQWHPPLSGNAWTQTIYSPGTYSVSITSCGIVTDTSVTIGLSVPLANISAGGPLTFCEGDSVLLTANSGMSNYVWNPGGITSQSFYATQSGIYTLTTIDSFGCDTTTSINVSTYPNIATEPLVSDTLICMNKSVVLTASGTGNIFWYESLSSSTVLASGNTYTTPLLLASEIYYVLSEDSGCRSDRVPVEVAVENCDSVFIPNVFTPNGDGFNEEFFFYVPVNECFLAKIYNRWGRLMFEWSDAAKGWNGTNQNNGKPAVDGVYYYILWYCTGAKVQQTAHGFLELLR
jgi:gliding motility-associated-like protein